MQLKTTAEPDGTEDDVFDRIGLTLSGGGYRAAAFHLGSMSYLHLVRHPKDDGALLERVKFLSTISGGTITGAVYAAALVRHGNAAFPVAYRQLHRFLRDDTLLRDSLKTLREAADWPATAGGKARNLINAFSLQYRALTGEVNFDQLCQCLEGSPPFRPVHLDVIAFGATDLRNGHPFRFQNAGVLGNNFAQVGKTFRPDILLGDIVAASSAFPGGFEPIRFPDDFLTGPGSEAHLAEIRESAAFEKPLELLDGGILSNQGFDALELFLKRKKPAPSAVGQDGPPTLLIVSDVAGYYHERDPTVAANGAPTSGLSLRWVSILVCVLAAVVLLLVALGLAGVIDSLLPAAAAFPVALLVVLIPVFLLTARLRRELAEALGSFGHVLSVVREAKLTNLPYSRVKPLVRSRLLSAAQVVGDVFLDRNRRRDTSALYRLAGHRGIVSNYVYSLSSHRSGSGALPLTTDDLSPRFLRCLARHGLTVDDLNGNRLAALADAAEAFGTVLWFTPEQQKRDCLRMLIAVGQFTLCFKLMMHTNEILKNAPSGARATVVEELAATFAGHFKRFNADPYWLYDELAASPIRRGTLRSGSSQSRIGSQGMR